MRFHNITKDDQNNGSGLRVVLWLSGCEHRCEGCHNKITWSFDNGIVFDDEAKKELFDKLNKPYISGITFSGGDPLAPSNIEGVSDLISEIGENFTDKNIWIYTGYTWEQIMSRCSKEDSLCYIVASIDVLVDGKFIECLKDENYHWAGSTNQRVIDVQKTIQSGNIVLLEE